MNKAEAENTRLTRGKYKGRRIGCFEALSVMAGRKKATSKPSRSDTGPHRELLAEVASALETWAVRSLEDGWDNHVDAQTKLASKIRLHLASTERKVTT